MSQEKETRETKKTPVRFTRRQFLKDAGLVIGGAALSHVALVTACDGAQATTSSPPTSTPVTTFTPTTSSPTPTATATPGATTSKTTSATSSPAGDVYVPPEERPPLTETPGCTSFVAFDRLYCAEHTWVKQLSANRAVMGVTDKLQLLMDAVTKVALPSVGATVRAGTSYGESEGFKMNVELITPVSIKVLQINEELFADMHLMNTDPFVKGWTVYVELTKPEELKSLISPFEYMMLQAKDVTTKPA